MSISAKPSFSLKDHLFNQEKVSMIADQIQAVHPPFKKEEFVLDVVTAFPTLELMDRLYHVRDCLRLYLPADYQPAVRVLLRSLPPELDPTKTDNDFGEFIYGPYGAFVAEYGCTADDVTFSLAALRQITKRFSVEFPIRSFINAFQVETMAFLSDCATDDNYHVRRLASEGTRAKLPWAKKINIDYTDPLPLLDVLFADNTRYVTRSVANHLNDIAKVDPKLVISTLQRWKKSGQQTTLEMQFITRHSLRTLEKQGNAQALQLLGYKPAQINVSACHIANPIVVVGGALEFSFTVTATGKQPQALLIDYNLYYKKASGELTPKTFKIAKTTMQPGETVTFSKRQPLRPMTTRVLHAGVHAIELQINGQVYPQQQFDLVAP